MREINVKAAGSNLRIVGHVEKYLDWYDGWDADAGGIFHAAASLPANSTCIDAGANIGVMAISLAVQRPDCQIIAIEPVTANEECLRQNIQLNNVSNIEVIHAALGAEHGEVQMTDNGPWSSVWADGSLTVPVIMLDDFGDRDIDFIKIDCEGYEPQILSGGKGLLRRQRPLMHVEFNAMFLMLQKVDVIAFAKTLWDEFDMLGVYYQEQWLAPPRDHIAIVHDNVTKFASVSDLLMRPKANPYG